MSWVCYILKSVDSCHTYVGATDNLYRRLCDHNGIHGISKGAFATKNRQWYPILYVNGFSNKIACLSFETGIRRMIKRKGKKIKINKYLTPIHKRILCLLNLILMGGTTGKWNNNYLQINWLEKELFYSTNHFQLPNNCIHNIDINNMCQMNI